MCISKEKWTIYIQKYRYETKKNQLKTCVWKVEFYVSDSLNAISRTTEKKRSREWFYKRIHKIS